MIVEAGNYPLDDSFQAVLQAILSNWALVWATNLDPEDADKSER